ncbi:CAAX prenyl protease-related protein [Duganella sp. FT80W]|uniref:CAAX prenyl protease-related protein n=2 Tax=Duganella guangzhouensis TaxID=2666084 RepID=A0A6I2L835_9BURK|nr:CAAX prenyl protease-related protein [Duganella guangzhouensis]
MPPHAWPRIAPFAAYMAFVVLADLLARAGWAAPSLLWLYPLKIAAVVVLLLCYRRHYAELAAGRPRWRELWLALAAGVLVLVLWLHLDADWMVMGTSPGYQPLEQGRLHWPLLLVRLAGGVLVVPLMEELFWRSFLLRWISAPDFLAQSPAAVTLRAFVVAALLFGVEHQLWLAGVVAGAVYSGLYMYSRNLWTPILAHAITNGGLGLWIIATGNWTYW